MSKVTFNNMVEFMENGARFHGILNSKHDIVLRPLTQEEKKNLTYKPVVIYPVKRPYLDELKFVLSNDKCMNK